MAAQDLGPDIEGQFATMAGVDPDRVEAARWLLERIPAELRGRAILHKTAAGLVSLAWPMDDRGVLLVFHSSKAVTYLKWQKAYGGSDEYGTANIAVDLAAIIDMVRWCFDGKETQV